PAFVAHARAYLELLGDHIAKEDDVLFPMADQLMTPGEAEELMSEFEDVEEEQEEAHRKYLGIVRELEEYLGIE
ncbi:MAG: cation-binding protein, partial [Thermoplasmata archaeon]